MTFDGVPDAGWSVSRGLAATRDTTLSPSSSSSPLPSSVPVALPALQVPADTPTHLRSDVSASPLSFIWPFATGTGSETGSGVGAGAAVGTPYAHDAEGNETAALKQQLLAMTTERDELRAEKMYRGSKDKDSFSQGNPLALTFSGKRMKDYESRLKIEGEMITQLEAEKSYLEDALKVAQGLVESSHQLTKEKQQRIDELEREGWQFCGASRDRSHGQVNGVTSPPDRTQEEARRLESLLAAKQQKIDELEQGWLSAKYAHQEKLSGAMDMVDAAEAEIRRLQDRLAAVEGSPGATDSGGREKGEDVGEGQDKENDKGQDKGQDKDKERDEGRDEGQDCRKDEVIPPPPPPPPPQAFHSYSAEDHLRMVVNNRELSERVKALEIESAADKKKISGLLAQLRTVVNQKKGCGSACMP